MVPAAVEAFDDDDDIDLPVFSNKAGLAEVQKQKKAKETPEQKAARVERQKIKEAKKAAAEEKAAAAARKIDAESFSDFNAFASSPTQAFDGWAVVEKSKSKTKKESDEAASPVNAAPEVVAPVAAAVEPTPAAPQLPVIETITVPMTVDSKKLGLLIGPKGVTKIGIQQATGATIEMPKVEKDAPPSSVVVNVTGTEASVNRAIHALNELCVKGYSVLLAGDDFQEGYVAIHPRFLPDVIGKQGVVIRALQQYTGVKITTPANTSKTDGTAATKIKINLAGPREKVTEARNLIKEITKYYHTAVTHPGVVHTELDVPANYYNYIIGAKGSEIKHIQANFKVNVYIPNAESNYTGVLIVGEPANVASAEKHVQKLIEKVNAAAETRAAEDAKYEAIREAQKAARAATAAAANTAAPATGNYSVGGGGKPSTAKVDKNDEPEEEWMREFAPRSSGMDFSAMLPATSKFVAPAAPVAAEAEAEKAVAAEEPVAAVAAEGKSVWGAGATPV